ncbi:transposase (plasmid) [Cupriavidus necator N-1]|uniref:Transposase n=1 Tax=Cupriavidus necator (strain ATCC 43291 / DSM 13513 / CCUG 52238 / LMG 8453 / N-1) TaxID=1042878 RepID=F8GUM4_CUPNN|nr:transposase [Cupriavidus necator N-1]
MEIGQDPESICFSHGDFGFVVESLDHPAGELLSRPEVVEDERCPQSNGMAESFLKTMKRDYVAFMPKPDAETAVHNLAIAFEHYNEQHPRSTLHYRSPREFRRAMA